MEGEGGSFALFVGAAACRSPDQAGPTLDESADRVNRQMRSSSAAMQCSSFHAGTLALPALEN